MSRRRGRALSVATFARVARSPVAIIAWVGRSGVAIAARIGRPAVAIVTRILGRSLVVIVARILGRPVVVIVALVALLGRPAPVAAGAQQYEDLSAAVRSALTAAAADPAVAEPIWESRAYRIDWLAQMSGKLPLRHLPEYRERVEFLTLVRYEAQRAGLEPELVLGLIQVESGFRRHAISSAGALGYMQVMPFWTRLLSDGDPRQLFGMRTNIRYGCLILRHYLDREKGDLFLALGRYNGSRGRAEYPNAVLAAWQRWRFQPTRPLPAPGP